MVRGLDFANVFFRIEPKEGGGFQTTLSNVEAITSNPTATQEVDRGSRAVPHVMNFASISSAVLGGIQNQVLAAIRAAVTDLS